MWCVHGLDIDRDAIVTQLTDFWYVGLFADGA